MQGLNFEFIPISFSWATLAKIDAEYDFILDTLSVALISEIGISRTYIKSG